MDGAVEERVVEGGERKGTFGFQVEDDDLVVAFFEPGAGDIERLLRADVPIAAERVAVDPDRSFAEGAHVEKRVRRFWPA